MVVDTRELSRTIEVTPNDHVGNIDLFIVVDAVQSSQHCKIIKKREKNKLLVELEIDFVCSLI